MLLRESGMQIGAGLNPHYHQATDRFPNVVFAGATFK